MKTLSLLVLGLLFLSFTAKSNDTANVSLTGDSSMITFSDDSTFVRIGDSLNLRILRYDTTGSIDLSDGLAKFDIPAGFKFLSPEQSAYVLSELWGNPPSPSGGMIFPASAGSLIPETWAIEISYVEEGHVKDDDAKDIDYDDLLEQMQEQVRKENPQRKAMGYHTAELLGWASPPYYDETTKKLHWAKRLMFEENLTETLNYNIRILGRKGYLELNAIGGMEQLDTIKQNIDLILSSVNFTQGNRYEDFNESTDKLAAYGIGGLVAGGILAKTGLLAKIGIFFAKFAKIFIVGAIALGGVLFRWFKGKGNQTA